MDDDRELYILYGSQTGNSEDIAKSLYEKCITLGYKCKLATLNTVKKTSLKDIAKALIIVCSTTGNGDPPENCEGFWRAIKSRAIAKDYFLGVPYSVLGLGDTNYDKFCYMGKMLDKRLAELGGKQILPLACADEPTNLEETVEQWNKSVLGALEILMSPPKESKSSTSDSSITLSTDLNGNETANANTNDLPEPANSTEFSCAQKVPAEGVLSLALVCTHLGIALDSVCSQPDPALLPRSKACVHDLTLLTSEELCSMQQPTSSGTSVSKEGESAFDARTPYLSHVTNARWLTTLQSCSQYQLPEGSLVKGAVTDREWGSTKRVVHLELSLGNSGIQYTPGDAIGICCPNPTVLVTKVLDCINTAGNGTKPITPQTQVMWQKEQISVEELLSYRLDLVSTVRKDAVMVLANHCNDEKESAQMRWLCSKSPQYVALWKTFVEAQCLGMVEFLSLFPSCNPTLEVLSSILRPLPPRYYSIASSPLQHQSTVAVAFSLVRYRCGISDASGALLAPGIQRSGLCSSFLEESLSPWLMNNRPDDRKGPFTVQLRMFLKQTATFRLPSSMEHPLILIGPGTGVAPFMGFLAHRAMLQRSLSDGRLYCDASEGLWRGGYEILNSDLPAETIHQGLGELHCQQRLCRASTHLFFGCRGDDDYLYKDELQAHVLNGTLTSLEVAMSRKSAEKVYVTHRLSERGAEMASLILNMGGYVYICGDGNKMAKDVHSALVSMLSVHGNLTAPEAEKVLSEMKSRRKYVLDIWS